VRWHWLLQNLVLFRPIGWSQTRQQVRFRGRKTRGFMASFNRYARWYWLRCSRSFQAIPLCRDYRIERLFHLVFLERVGAGIRLSFSC